MFPNWNIILHGKQPSKPVVHRFDSVFSTGSTMMTLDEMEALDQKHSKAMARPTSRQNRLFWELIVAFMLVVSAAVFQTFHFFNNAWLVQNNGSYIYQRGLGDDCVKNDDFPEGIKCTEWSDSKNTFVINGQHITSADVVPPPINLKMARILMIFSILLYLIVTFSLFFTCVKRDLKVQKLLCGATVLLVLINLLIMLLVLVGSSEPFIKIVHRCSVGNAFYYFLLSNLLLWIGSAAHFDSWIDVYVDLRTSDMSPFRGFFRSTSEGHNLAEHRPSFLSV